MSRRQEWLGDLFPLFLLSSMLAFVWDGWNRSLLLSLLSLTTVKWLLAATAFTPHYPLCLGYAGSLGDSVHKRVGQY
jgi:hypothetical protein